ncbi:unnamed protein product [Gongylonema pulchrum]|uniref:ANK_REP_REGION domain-containing protein n=1 Tax=Gongylonema pulchrum TaxID=637853 RepID=A0A183DP78_9BILA|nr:unnamed protein product [Gongylonema pulchrum]
MFSTAPMCTDSCTAEGSTDPDSQPTTARTPSSQEEELNSSALFLAPVCNFIIETFFSQCYAVIFTLYSVNCADQDARYWERMVNLNAFTDVKLLAFLEINRDLWPIDIENADDLETPLIRATARKKFYKSAIRMLQQISSHSNPTSKLAVLANTFTEICAVSSHL